MPQKDIPARRLIDNYPTRIVIRTLFSDMDVFRHLNNGAIGRYFEEGRANLNMQAFGEERLKAPVAGEQLLFVSVALDFLAQSYYPGNVDIATGVIRIGASSYTVAQAGFQNGTCFALAEAVLVKAVDGRAVALSDVERSALQALQLAAQS